MKYNPMVDMYVLIVCDLGRTEEIATDLQEIDMVKEVYMISGAYDIIVKMSGPSPKDLEHVYSKIRNVSGIKTTITLVGYTKHGY
jgi:DNA-binding Lrp family transcriptional regulator